MNHQAKQQQTQRTINPAAPRTVAQASAAPAAQPTHREISSRAYDLYLKTGSQKGNSEKNWQQAEHDLRKQSEPVRSAVPKADSSGGSTGGGYSKA